MTTIEIKNYTKVIKKNTVLNDITLSMTSGKIYGFQGINGSGKNDAYEVNHRADTWNKR